MSFYSSNHPGVILDDTTLTNLGIKETDLRGYFTKKALRTFLNENPDSAGIRIYNINSSSRFPSLLAICVLSNGAEIKDANTLRCESIESISDSVLQLSREMSLIDIREVYSFDVQESEKFSSFFSIEMLKNLLLGLENNTEHTGIAFYKVIWLGGRSTHLAVTAHKKPLPPGSIKKSPIIGLEGTGFNNCLSDQPCPGHCVKLDENGVEVVSPEPMISDPDDLDAHYIPVWQ